MNRILIFFFSLVISIAATADTGKGSTFTCTQKAPRFKITSTIEVQKSIDPQTKKEKITLTSELDIDGKKIPSLQKTCTPKRCPHRDGENVLEVYPHFDPGADVIRKVDVLLWSGANVNRISLTDCKTK